MEKTNFIDLIKVFAEADMVAQAAGIFCRNKLTAFGGPDGGDGGRGAHIILRGNKNLWTLLHLRYYKNIFAENGENGSKNNCTGRDGKDIIIEVPLGTIATIEETGKKVEILEDGEEKILLKGGRGGLGNSHFATPTNQAPEHSQPGEPGRKAFVSLELKVLGRCGFGRFSQCRKINFAFCDHCSKTKNCGLCFYHFNAATWHG